MKRFLAMLLMLCMALAATSAAAEYIGNMEVVNCNEWVSLRELPRTTAKRLVKVSLGAIVSNCQQMNDQWIYAEYDGYGGYILAKYLQPSGGQRTFNAMMITVTGDGAPLYATIDSEEPVDHIPANTIVRNCCMMDNDRIYVEWGSRCGFIRLGHAEVYDEMLHFPRQITLHYNPYGSGHAPSTDLKITELNDFPIKEYDYNEYEYDDFMTADSEDIPKVKFVLHSDVAVSNVHLFSVWMSSWDDETGDMVYEATLEDIQYQVDPEHPLCVGAVIWGDMPNLAVGFEDASGAYHFAFIEISGEDGSLILREF